MLNMFDNLNHLIKPDAESQVSFENFKAEFRAKNEERAKSALKRATALLMGASTVISLLFLLFAFVTKTNAEEEKAKFEIEIHSLQKKLEDCSTN